MKCNFLSPLEKMGRNLLADLLENKADNYLITHKCSYMS